MELTPDIQVDFSRELVEWTKKMDWSLLDVNLFPKPFANPKPVSFQLRPHPF